MCVCVCVRVRACVCMCVFVCACVCACVCVSSLIYFVCKLVSSLFSSIAYVLCTGVNVHLIDID